MYICGNPLHDAPLLVLYTLPFLLVFRGRLRALGRGIRNAAGGVMMFLVMRRAMRGGWSH